ncbi:hypothetical protein GH714_038060 [Hevea brasiliensis]|uniref:Uncharacterized protein n=1 Tax=Hevea brasiliensis TaxID=3981 RepID=A0A6A6MMR7_HEVBR|nr:hypothetical protein GH714_038060 [Hevea brasiliensis]
MREQRLYPVVYRMFFLGVVVGTTADSYRVADPPVKVRNHLLYLLTKVNTIMDHQIFEVFLERLKCYSHIAEGHGLVRFTFSGKIRVVPAYWLDGQLDKISCFQSVAVYILIVELL